MRQLIIRCLARLLRPVIEEIERPQREQSARMCDYIRRHVYRIEPEGAVTAVEE